MSDNENFGFTKFVPGFDFLQSIAKGATQAMPQLSHWVAPTLNVEELEKRIAELKTVHFWLEQNSKALSATIQALEVQKMTLATLRGMNVSMGEVANAMKVKVADAMSGMQKAAEAAAGAAGASASASAAASAPAAQAAEPAAAPAPGMNGAGATNNEAAPKVVDPLQWWGALTQQFQQIAAGALKDTARTTGLDGAAEGAARARPASAKRPPARKSVSATSGAAKTAAAPATRAATRTPAKSAAGTTRKSGKGSGG